MNPSLAHFQLLRRLRQQLRHHSGVGVVYLFSDYALANQWLAAELDAHLRAKSLCLRMLRPAGATEAPSKVLAPLLAASNEAVAKPFWLALGEPLPEWDLYRDTVLARLNENRSVLGRNHVFIFLVLPTHFQNRAAEIAPDLWSVRSASHVVAPWRIDNDDHHQRDRQTAPSLVAAEQDPGVLAAMLQRWQTLGDRWLREPNQRPSPSLAWQLVDRLRELQQPKQAQLLAEQALEISRQLTTLDDSSAQSLRDLSVSLDKVGDVARDLGQLDEARSAYQESLEISRQLTTLTGNSAQSLRDLSVSVEKVGDVARDLGQLDEARSAYQESLDISRQLSTLDDSSAQSLRDFSVSLNKVGDVARDLGLLEEARNAHQESLKISRQLTTLTGHSPQSLRDLSVSLEKVGNVVYDLGQLEEARNAFAEALGLVKRLREVLSADRELAPMEKYLQSKLTQIEQAPGA